MPPIRILLVEDNHDLRCMLAELLESPGRDVRSCASAEQALAELAGQPVHALITDVTLPGMSGIELARQALVDVPDRWVVLCSGSPLPDEAASWGANVRLLRKPFELHELDQLLDAVSRSVRSAEV